MCRDHARGFQGDHIARVRAVSVKHVAMLVEKVTSAAGDPTVMMEIQHSASSIVVGVTWPDSTVPRFSIQVESVRPMIATSLVHTKELLKTATRGSHVPPGSAQMPLASHVRGVSCVAQALGQERLPDGSPTLVACQSWIRAHVTAVAKRISASHESGTGWRADGHRVEIRQSHTGLQEVTHHRGLAAMPRLLAKRTQVVVAEVIKEHQQDVWAQWTIPRHC